MTSTDSAIRYRKRGWFPIPITARSKIPPVQGWQLLRIELEDIPKYFTGAMNVGILTGAVSQNLIDVDLDCQAAIRLAPRFLPPTIMFGRNSRPLSHWLYTAYGTRTEVFATPSRLWGKKEIAGNKVEAQTLLELRADGKQTVFPHSIHECGELIEWASDIDQQQAFEIKAETLRSATARLAAACLLVHFDWTDEEAIEFALHPVPSKIAGSAPEIQQLMTRWLGAAATLPTGRVSAENEFTAAAVRWNSEHPIDFAKRNSGPCPICNDSKSFGQLKTNTAMWSCFSTDHPDNVGRQSPNKDCYIGDSLDLEAFKLGKSRAQILRDVGYLKPHLKVVHAHAPAPSNGHTQQPPDDDAYDAPPPPEPPEGEEDTRPQIQLSPEVHEVVDQAVAALYPATEMFQRGSHLVRVTKAMRSPMHTELFGPTPSIEPLASATVMELISKYAKVHKFDGRRKEWVHTIPPPWLINGVLERGTWRGIRPLEGIVEVPTMRMDGSVLDVPGYDEQTGLIYQPAIDFSAVSAAPTRQDAVLALESLRDLVGNFPFAPPKKLYESAWLAALLTPFIRTSIPTAPMFLVDSNIRGSGKSKLCDIISIISTGRPMPRTVNPPHDEEFKKLVTSLAIAGASLVMIDNITGSLGSQALDAVITAPTWKDRILGKSEVTKEIPLTTIWFATGNNVELRGDLCRRTIHIRLKTNNENPETRQDFKYKDLIAHVQKERHHLVHCALTILRAYVAAGAPPQKMRTIDFREWSALVRGALVWLEMPDPGETQVELAQGDSDRTGIALMLDALGRFSQSSTGLSTSTILRLCSVGDEDSDALREAVSELCPTRDGKPPSAVSLGKRLGAVRGRVVNKRCIDKHATDSRQWVVVSPEEEKL